jgi:hypothetical protein
MRTRLWIGCMLVMLLSVDGGLSQSAAKPPDLPINETIDCQAPANEAQPRPETEAHLGQLQRARSAYQRAEYYRRTAHPMTACRYYEQVQRLCPGSSYAGLATTRLIQLRVQKTFEVLGVGEGQEANWARQLAQALEGTRLGNPGAVFGSFSVGANSFFFEPPLPPVDPSTVETMEKLLLESGALVPPRRTVELIKESVSEETQEGPEQETLGSPWRDEMPGACKGLAEENTHLPPEGWHMPLPGDWLVHLPVDCPLPSGCLVGDLLRKVLDAVQTEVDIEISSPDGESARPVFDLQIGKVEVSVIVDVGGPDFPSGHAQSEPGDDLRAAQRSHNDQIIHWIEKLSERSTACAPDDSGDEP